MIVLPVETVRGLENQNQRHLGAWESNICYLFRLISLRVINILGLLQCAGYIGL